MNFKRDTSGAVILTDASKSVLTIAKLPRYFDRVKKASPQAMDLKARTTRACKKLLRGVAAWLGFEPRKCPAGNGDDRSFIEHQLLSRAPRVRENKKPPRGEA